MCAREGGLLVTENVRVLRSGEVKPETSFWREKTRVLVRRRGGMEAKKELGTDGLPHGNRVERRKKSELRRSFKYGEGDPRRRLNGVGCLVSRSHPSQTQHVKPKTTAN